MHLQTALAVLASAAHLASAAPAAESNKQNAPLRLIKTSEEDPGRWVTEEEKAKLVLGSKRINFIDITDIQVRETMPTFERLELTLVG